MVTFTFNISDTANNLLNEGLLFDEITKAGYPVVDIITKTTTFDVSIADDTVQITQIRPIVEAHTGVDNRPDVDTVDFAEKDGLGSGRVVIMPRGESGKTVITHNYGDPSSWWAGGTRKTFNCTPKVAGQYDVYTIDTLGDTLVDFGNGKITFEDRLFDYTNNSFMRPTVLVNGTPVAWDPVPVGGIGSREYSIDYVNNEITFKTPLTATDVVTVDALVVVDSTTIIAPAPGKQLIMEYVEIQFSANTDFSSRWLVFELWIGGAPYGVPAIYKNILDYLNESNNSEFSIIPAHNGLQYDIHSYVWRYPGARVLKSSMGMEVRTYLYDPTTGRKDLPMLDTLGNPIEYGTGTFYCLSQDEPI